MRGRASSAKPHIGFYRRNRKRDISGTKVYSFGPGIKAWGSRPEEGQSVAGPRAQFKKLDNAAALSFATIRRAGEAIIEI